LGVSVVARPTIVEGKLEVRIAGLSVGGMPFPPKWLIRVLNSSLEEGGPVTMDPDRAHITVDLAKILPEGMRVSSLELENGSLKITLTGE